LIWVKRRPPDGLKLPCTMPGSQFTLHSTRPGGPVAALFAVLGAAALLVLLLRPACDLLPTHAAGAEDPAACCASVEGGDALAAPDLATPGPGGKAPVGPLAIAFLAAALFPRSAPLFASAPSQTRSFYARSARIRR
jgi:hypothetical protein